MKKIYTLFILVFALALPAAAQRLEPSAPLGGRGRSLPHTPTYNDRQPFTPGLEQSNIAPPASSLKPTKQPNPRPSTLPSAANYDDLVAQRIAYAVTLYPALAQKDSAHNRAYIALYAQTRQNNPESLADPDWPVRLAIRSASPPESQPPAAQGLEPTTLSLDGTRAVREPEPPPERATAVVQRSESPPASQPTTAQGTEPAMPASTEPRPVNEPEPESERPATTDQRSESSVPYVPETVRPETQGGTWLERHPEVLSLSADLLKAWITQKFCGGQVTPEQASQAGRTLQQFQRQQSK